jgi:hypothetical protein
MHLLRALLGEIEALGMPRPQHYAPEFEARWTELNKTSETPNNNWFYNLTECDLNLAWQTRSQSVQHFVASGRIFCRASHRWTRKPNLLLVYIPVDMAVNALYDTGSAGRRTLIKPQIGWQLRSCAPTHPAGSRYCIRRKRLGFQSSHHTLSIEKTQTMHILVYAFRIQCRCYTCLRRINWLHASFLIPF